MCLFTHKVGILTLTTRILSFQPEPLVASDHPLYAEKVSVCFIRSRIYRTKILRTRLKTQRFGPSWCSLCKASEENFHFHISAPSSGHIRSKVKVCISVGAPRDPLQNMR